MINILVLSHGYRFFIADDFNRKGQRDVQQRRKLTLTVCAFLASYLM